MNFLIFFLSFSQLKNFEVWALRSIKHIEFLSLSAENSQTENLSNIYCIICFYGRETCFQKQQTTCTDSMYCWGVFLSNFYFTLQGHLRLCFYLHLCFIRSTATLFSLKHRDQCCQVFMRVFRKDKIFYYFWNCLQKITCLLVFKLNLCDKMSLSF
jgi:hypothetical protein